VTASQFQRLSKIEQFDDIDTLPHSLRLRCRGNIFHYIAERLRDYPIWQLYLEPFGTRSVSRIETEDIPRCEQRQRPDEQ
jgi:hypothetical protein